MADPEHRTFESKTSRRMSRQDKGHRSSDDVSMQRNEVSTPPSDITFAFMNLPPELRLNFYDYAVPATLRFTELPSSTYGENAGQEKHAETSQIHTVSILEGVNSRIGSELGYGLPPFPYPGRLPALSRTNRTVRNEVRKHFFGQNTFVIDMDRLRDTFAWLRAMSPRDSGNMRRLLILGHVKRYDEAFRSTPRTRRYALLFAIEVDLAAAGQALSIHKWLEAEPNINEANRRLAEAASIIEVFTRRWNVAQVSPGDRKAGLIRMLRKVRYSIATPRLGLLPLILEYVWFLAMLVWFFLNIMALRSGDSSGIVGLLR
ncbi:hypothetical protein LTR10_002718 [Elasticomyces elasticus]|nr:hypothetical protein LTR10_002718 [Elasticomyces elasticus]KAK4967941.1 hypothetical protein LTR42_010269 [Elasticomyces elasticus]